MNSGIQKRDSIELWQYLTSEHLLTDIQVRQFEQYVSLLNEWNKKTNITRITSEEEVILYHLHDSLLIGQYVDITSRIGMADVGSGGGFPGIPLKIKYPELPVVLIEVNSKKISFLEAVIKELDLKDIMVCSLDWRTFLRKSDYAIDLFCSRASLHPDELVRIFSPTCRYRHATLVYWASINWQVQETEKEYLRSEQTYTVGDKERKYVFFALPEVIEHV